MRTTLPLLALSSCAFAQATFPAAFVGNNGNLRGSVSSYRVDAATGNLTLIEELVIGERAASAPNIPGTNVYSLSLTPDGGLLAATHATASTTVEQVTLITVYANGTLEPLSQFTTPDSPLDSVWLSETVLAVTRTSAGGTNEVIVYSINRVTGAAVEIDREPAGLFCAYLAIDPSRTHLFASDADGFAIRCFAISPDGRLTHRSTLRTSCYPLGIDVHRDGSRIFGGGGISVGGRAVLGAYFNWFTGDMGELSGSPYPGGAASPNKAIDSPDGTRLIVGYSDGYLRLFSLAFGTPLPVGVPFGIGQQGEVGNLATLDLPGRQVILVTDKESYTAGTGLISLTLTSDNRLVQNGPKVASGGVGPTDIAAWMPDAAPPCIADYNGDGGVDGADVEAFFIDWQAGDPAADVNQDGGVDGGDVETFFLAWEAGGC